MWKIKSITEPVGTGTRKDMPVVVWADFTDSLAAPVVEGIIFCAAAPHANL